MIKWNLSPLSVQLHLVLVIDVFFDDCKIWSIVFYVLNFNLLHSFFGLGSNCFAFCYFPTFTFMILVSFRVCFLLSLLIFQLFQNCITLLFFKLFLVRILLNSFVIFRIMFHFSWSDCTSFTCSILILISFLYCLSIILSRSWKPVMFTGLCFFVLFWWVCELSPSRFNLRPWVCHKYYMFNSHLWCNKVDSTPDFICFEPLLWYINVMVLPMLSCNLAWLWIVRWR